MQYITLQLNTVWQDRAANHQTVRNILDRVVTSPDTLIVLPEMFDVGFSMNAAATEPGEPSASEAFLREIAINKRTAILAGVVARAGDGKLANEAVAYDRAGLELVRYRKMQPFTGAGEEQHYIAGTGHRLFNWGGMVVAPFICYDLRFPELFRRAARDGAELFVVIANWPARRSEHWVRLLQARAIENQAFVLGVNRAGSDPTLTYDGRTSLFDPQGKQLLECDGREQINSGQIDPGEVRQWRRDFGALRDMKHI